MNSKFIFKYRVVWYNEINNWAETVNTGIVLADTFAEAMEKIAKSYDDEAIQHCTIDCVADNYSVMELSEDVVRAIEGELQNQC